MSPSRRTSPRHFLAGLSPTHFEAFRGLMVPRNLEDGDYLFRQGDSSREAWFLDEGKAELLLDLSGGGTKAIGTVHEGEITGEMALLRPWPRTASARAIGPVRALVVDQRDFKAMLSWFHPVSLAVLRRLVLLVATRVDDTTARLAGGPPTHAHPGETSEPGAPGADFDPTPFLTQLPFFQSFTEADAAALLARGTLRTLPRGALLFGEGHAPRHASVVIRGALQMTAQRDGQRQRLGLYAPGTVAGATDLILGGHRRTTACRARETTVVLQLSREVFDPLFDGDERLSFKLLEGLSDHLVHRLSVLSRAESRVSRGGAAADEPVAPMGTKRVLIVDDSPMNRDLLALQVHELGHEVVEAEHGAHALELLETEEVHAILLDVRMPVLDGMATLERLKADLRWADIPVLMVTSSTGLDTSVKSLRLGADDLLPRSADPALLHARLTEALQRAHTVA